MGPEDCKYSADEQVSSNFSVRYKQDVTKVYLKAAHTTLLVGFQSGFGF
jgi:hypothetical protein